MPASGTVGVVLDSIMVQRLVPALVRQLSPNRQVWLVDLYRPVEELVDMVRSRQTIGLITRWVDGITDRLADLGIPMVAYSFYGSRPNVICFDVDNAAIGRAAARHFLDRGLRSFAFVGRDLPYSALRLASFRETVERSGYRCADFNLPAGQEHYFEYSPPINRRFSRWLAGLTKPVGVLTAYDKVAWELADACRVQHLRIPEQVAVLGVNDDPIYCGLARPTLSSVRVPWDRIGAGAARALERIVRRPQKQANPRQPILFSPEGITVRESTDRIAVPDPTLSRILRFMQSHAAEPVTINQVAGQAFCSRRRLETMFQTHLGRSPRKELERLRMERGDDLLRTTDLPVARVAEQCGYNYPERFSVAFKRTRGVTPIAFRRRLRASG